MKKINIIKLESISKKYDLKRFSSKKFAFFENSKNNDEHKVTWALKDVNFQVKAGQKIGIVGPNGSGKTTLLKIIAGISRPTGGSIIRNGKIVAILDLGHGFHPELTGRENIYINAMSLGMLKSEIDSKIKDIIAFADIGNYINYPFYTYSQGMKFRLACAVSLAYQADLLIIDEVIISGDLNFQKKILDMLAYLQSNSNMATIICSHNPQTLWAFANEFFVMENGRLRKINKKEVTRMSLDAHNQFHDAFRSKGIFVKQS